jgi:16S rRNA (uracil1498-N3)-methyltransferase
LRAVYYKFENDFSEDVVRITGDSAHHLMVARVRSKEKVLLLNGSGVKIQGEVLETSKNSIEIKIHSKEEFKPEHQLSLAIAMPKKDAFEDILKIAVELGIREIHPLVSAFSQYEYAPSERIERILESALVQSNNPFFPIIHAQRKLSDFLSMHSDELVFFNSLVSNSKNHTKKDTKKTILVGPEGGFSSEEVENILKYPQILEVHLPTPILRAPTAVASSVGYLLASLN